MLWMSCSRSALATTPVAVLLVLAATFTAAAGQRIGIDDVSRLQRIDSVGVSPDGGLVVCSVGDACSDGRSRLWLASLVNRDAEPVRLTTGDRDDRHPVFAPNSRTIAFYRLDDRGLHQAHVIPVGGGEAFGLAALPSGVDASVPPVWSPDGRTLLVTGWMEDGAVGEPVVERIGDAPMFSKLSSARRGLWMLDASGGRRDSIGPLGDFADCSEGVFADGGRTVYCTVVLPGEAEPGRAPRTAVARFGIGGPDSGDADASQPFLLFEDPDYDLSSPRVSPSGSVLAVLGRSQRSSFFEPRRLGVFELGPNDSPSPAWLTGEEAFDRSVRSFRWRSGQDVLLLNAFDDGGVDLLTISRTLLSGPRVLVEHEDDLPVGITSFASGGGVVAMARTTVDAPSELWILDARGPRRIWNPNPWLEGMEVSKPETGWVTPRGEDPIPYWLYRPTDATEDRRLPIVIWLGAGPGTMLGPGLFGDWFPTQLLAAGGYAVLQVNPRGSAGYGRDVRRRIFRDFIRGPSRDVFAVLQHVRQEDQRLGSAGEMVIARGFGGLLAMWMIAAMPTIDAAVIEDGVFSVATGFAEHDDWSVLRELLGGLPQDPAVLSITREIDPAAHVDRIEASVLLLTGSTGGFVTNHGTALIYRMLSLGYKEVQRAAYRGDDRDAACDRQKDRFGRILDFLDQHVDRP